MIWFVFTTGLLRGEAVWRLFTFWGGEALYKSHEDDPEIGPLLRTPGTACIVEVAAPVRAIETYCAVGERLVRCFLHRRGVDTGHDPEVEGYVAEPIPRPRIRRVITRIDSDFEGLTGCSTWSEPPT